MLSIYIKELKRYYKNEISQMLNLGSDDTEVFIAKLMSLGFLKMVFERSEERELIHLSYEELDLIKNEEPKRRYYVFTFVGILISGNIVLKCYPKYISEMAPIRKMKQIFHVLRRYNSKKQIINISNGFDDLSAVNMLPLILFIIEDYSKNGVYSNERVTIEINGMGEILWDETINESFAIIKNNRPIYPELKNLFVDLDEQDFFRRLHSCIVTQSSKILEDCELSDLFDLNTIHDSDSLLSDFGDNEYILYRLQRELEIQYNDRKKLILRALHAYISNKKAFDTGVGITSYGTNTFNLVWEDVCKDIYDNQLKSPLKVVLLPKGENKLLAENSTLLDIIKKPKWRYKSTNIHNDSTRTLVPDLISIYKYKDNYCFAILDAKYYSIKFSRENISGQPGVEDITKQYLYQIAYKEFIANNGFKYTQNAFLVPGDGLSREFIGSVKFEIISETNIYSLDDISAIKIPTELAYNSYINGRTNEDLYDILRESHISEYGEVVSDMP